MEILDKIAEELEFGEDEVVPRLTRQAVEQGVSAQVILQDGLLKGMGSIGVKFKNHEVFLPDVLLAAKAMHGGMEILKPLLIADGAPAKGKIILGTVKGDLHDIGKNLVAIMLKSAGYEVIDLGFDVTAEKFVETAKQENASVIGMSALLTTTMPMMKDVIELLKKEDLYGKVKTVIGGAPVSQGYADQIGADAYGFDGTNAVQCIEELMTA
ncbi:MAG: cobalamin-binding protein [bacterium]|nr:cobalamin-binding protein [bacterium]